MLKISENELQNFLKYLLEKVEDCYKKEAELMIERFIEQQSR